MVEIGEGLITKGALHLGMKNANAYFASDSLSLVLQEVIKKISTGEELAEIFKKGDLSVIKEHVGVPTTKITVKVG